MGAATNESTGERYECRMVPRPGNPNRADGWAVVERVPGRPERELATFTLSHLATHVAACLEVARRNGLRDGMRRMAASGKGLDEALAELEADPCP